MKIKDFFSKFKNHPILFIGTGLSLRYLKNSYSWDGLLKKICQDFKNEEYFFNLKNNNLNKNGIDYSKVASEIERDFNLLLEEDRDGKFKEINDVFFEYMKKYSHNSKTVSRFKIYLSSLLEKLEFRENKEIEYFKQMKKNIGSVITTNYDKLIEKLLDFTPLVGNDIILSNPYGSVYKIHGSVDDFNSIIITKEDYENFNTKYELIRAQLLSLFIHHPIIFLGYSVNDENIKKILKTIFSYVVHDSEKGEKIKENFLLIEYEKDNNNLEVSDYSIDFEDSNVINVKRIKTDNFIAIYKEISNLNLPISVMDIKKVQSVVKEIINGGEIKVQIEENLDSLNNNQMVLAIGHIKKKEYISLSVQEIILKYFEIIENNDLEILKMINKIKIQNNFYFPIFGFSKLDNKKEFDNLKEQQKTKILKIVNAFKYNRDLKNVSIKKIMEDKLISKCAKIPYICFYSYNKKIKLTDLEKYLKDNIEKGLTTDIRKLFCMYDYLKYADY